MKTIKICGCAICTTMCIMYLCGGTIWRCCLLLATFAHVAAASDSYKCPQGWTRKLKSCYKSGPGKMPFYAAEDHCRQLGAQVRVIKNAEENELFSGSSSGEKYWLGIRGHGDKSWRYETNGRTVRIEYTKFEGPTVFPFFFTHSCAVWESQKKVWLAERCTLHHLFMCQKSAVPGCAPGRFGKNCTKQCHCRGDVCDSTSGHCKYGCQIGWKGESCDTEKKKAKATFYCFKTEGRNVMMLHVDQRGTIYRGVSAVDEHGDTVDTCTASVYDYFKRGGMGKLKVTQNANGSFTPNCKGKELSDEVHSWMFAFRERPNVSSPYDITFGVNCDFTRADSLEQSSTISNTDKPANKPILLKQSNLSVSLDVIDPTSNQTVTTATLGQPVRLQLNLNNVDDFGVNGISPFNCSVGTLDHGHNVIFIDEHGCSVRDAQIVFENNDVTTWRTKMFETFAFLGSNKVYFRCKYHVCFKEEQVSCKPKCHHSILGIIGHRHRRSPIFTRRNEEVAEKLTTLEIV